MNIFKKDKNNDKIEVTILTSLNNHSSSVQAMNALIKKIQTKILSLKASDYEQLGIMYEQKLLALDKEFNDNILSINSEENTTKCDSGSYTLKLRDAENYYLPIYLSKLERLLDELEIKSTSLMISNLYNQLNQSSLEELVNSVLELKEFFFRNIKSFNSEEHKKINDKLYELIYALVKKELLEYDKSTLYDKLNTNDKINLNFFLINDIIKNLKDKKDIQKELIIKINLLHDNPFSIEVIKEYLAYLPRKREHKKRQEKEKIEDFLTNRRFVSKRKISPREFRELTGVSPFPRTKEENLILRTFDISCIDYKGHSLEGHDFSSTNIKFKIKDIYNCSLSYTNLEGVDLSDVDFKNATIQNANLKNTNAHINFQELGTKSIIGTNLEGLDLSDADFTKIFISGAKLKNTNAIINPQVVMNKDLTGTDLEGVNLSHANFKDVYIERAKFKNTKAIIDPQLVKWKSLHGTNLEGLDLSNVDFTGVDINEANLRNTNAKIDPRITKGFYNTDLRGCTFVVNDFTDCFIKDAIFDEGFVPYIREEAKQKTI